MPVDDRPRVSTKLAYGVGALSDSIKTFTFTTFLLFYYTTVLGLPGTWLGVAMSVGLVWDAAVDPLIGHFSDRTTAAFGRRHSFMIVGAIGAGVSLIAVFNPPAGLSPHALFAWLLASSLCLRSSNSLFMVPYYALGSELTTDVHERTSISGYRAAAVLAGTLIATAAAFLLFLPNDTAAGVDAKFVRGSYQALGAAFGAAMIVFALIATVGTLRERPRLAPAAPSDRRPAGLRRTIADAFADRPFRIVVWSSALAFMSTAINAALAMHFLTYHAGILGSAAVTMYYGAFYTGAMGGVFAWVRVARRTPKHHVYAAATMVMAVVMSAGYWLVGPGRPFGTGNVAVIVAANLLAGFFGIAGAVIVPSMIADIAADDERRSGCRRDGMFFGIYSFGQQLSGGVAVLLAGVLVDRFAGLIPAQAVQAPATIERLVIVSNVVPSIILAASAIVALQYRSSRSAAVCTRGDPVGGAAAGSGGDMTPTVCVTGGSGGIGRALLEQLLQRYRVKALFRSATEETVAWQRRGVIPVSGDLGDEAALAELVAGARFVFHCAAAIGGSYAHSRAVNVDGTRRLARAAAAAGCHRFVHVSSVAVYASVPGDADYTEATPLREDDAMAVYSLTKLQSEAALREVAAASQLEFTIVRPTCVYGPHTKSYTLVPVDLIRKGLPVVLGNGDGLLDVVYVDDVAEALVRAAESPRAAGEVFNVGHEQVTFNHFYEYYGRILNRRVRHVPTTVANGLVAMLERLPGAHTTSRSELRRGAVFMLAMSRNRRRFPSDKARALIGYAPRTDLPIGMLKTELWLKGTGQTGPTRYSLDGYGLLRFRPAALVHPRTEQELVQICEVAAAAKLPVKAIGSLHSQCAIPETDGVCVVLDHYHDLVAVNGPLVTVQAGMKLRDLNAALARHNLALIVSGSIVEQTVSGAISTGTHGGSIHYGSLSDYVEALTFVRADGTLLQIDRTHPFFPAAGVSLGLLGIVSTVTLRCVPAFALASRHTVLRAVEVIEAFDRINRGSLYIDMLYFPITDQVELLSIDRAEEKPTDSTVAQSATPAAPRPGMFAAAMQRAVIGGLKSIAWAVQRYRLNGIQRAITRRSVGKSHRPRTDRSDRVLAFGDTGAARSPFVIQDVEVAVPYDRAPAAISALRDFFMTSRKYPLLPVHIRCSAASDLWLSPAYGREVCWLEFWQYPPSDEWLRDVHMLLAPFEYRFHWGKEAPADRTYIRAQYPRWGDFERLRNAWDPAGRCSNAYTARFFPLNATEDGSADAVAPGQGPRSAVVRSAADPGGPLLVVPGEAQVAVHEQLVEKQ